MVYEEKYITVKEIPALQAVGWEGTYYCHFPFECK